MAIGTIICQDGGTFAISVNSTKCICAHGFTGDRCERYIGRLFCKILGSENKNSTVETMKRSLWGFCSVVWWHGQYSI